MLSMSTFCRLNLSSKYLYMPVSFLPSPHFLFLLRIFGDSNIFLVFLSLRVHFTRVVRFHFNFNGPMKQNKQNDECTFTREASSELTARERECIKYLNYFAPSATCFFSFFSYFFFFFHSFKSFSSVQFVFHNDFQF